MGLISERVSYLKGVAEGIKFDENSNESKLLKAMVEVIDEIATEVESMQELYDSLSEQVDEIDEDLAEMESLVEGSSLEESSEEFFAEIHCPHCGAIVEVTEFDLDAAETGLTCQECGGEISVEIGNSCCDCGCEPEEDVECNCSSEEEK